MPQSRNKSSKSRRWSARITQLEKLEGRETPRTAIFWDRVIKHTAAPGIYYQDFPELSGFRCPEWSYLSAGDSVKFSKRLAPHLRTALQM
jgi:hypothetical protein